MAVTNDLHVTFERSKTADGHVSFGVRVRPGERDAGEAGEGRHDEPDAQLQLTEALQRACINVELNCDAEDACRLGTEIWDELSSAHRLLAAYSEVPYARLLLHLDDAPELEALPWETLGPRAERPVRQSGWQVLRRRHTHRPPLEVAGGPLRVLVLVGCLKRPTRQHTALQHDAREAVNAITGNLAALGLEHTVAVTVTEIEKGFGNGGRWMPRTRHVVDSVFKLRDILREGGGYHVIHFIGHGIASHPRGATALGFSFPGSIPDVSLVGRVAESGPLFQDMLRGTVTRVVVLNACRSNEMVATPLLETVDHVVGMRGEIPGAFPTAWCRAFYGAFVGDFCSVGEAVRRTRAAIVADPAHRGLWWVPAHWTAIQDDRPFADPESLALGEYRSAAEHRLREFEGEFLEYGLALDRVRIELSIDLQARLDRPGAPDPGRTEAWRRSERSDLPTLTKLVMRESAHGSRWIVRGEPGSGKTTLLRHCARLLAKNTTQPRVGLYASLARWARWASQRHAPPTRASLVGYLWETHGLERPEADLAAAVKRLEEEGHLVVLLDDLDEVHDRDLQDVASLIQNLSRRESSTVVVATRTVGYARLPISGFQDAELQPLTFSQRRQLLHRWYEMAEGMSAARSRALAEATLARVEHPGTWLADLTRVPLFLNLIARKLASLARTEPDIPDLWPGFPQRDSFVHEIVRFLLECRHRPTGRRKPVRRPDEATAVLAALAWDMAIKGETRRELNVIVQFLTRRTTVGETIERCWGGVAEFLEQVEQSGLLAPRARRDRDGEWVFWHDAFQETLAARHLLALYRDEDGGFERLVDAVRSLDAAKRGEGLPDQQENRIRAARGPLAMLPRHLGDHAGPWIRALLEHEATRRIAPVAVTHTNELPLDIVEDVLARCDSWWQRRPVLEHLATRATDRLDVIQLLCGRVTPEMDRNDLFFIDEALAAIGRRHPDATGQVDGQRREILELVTRTEEAEDLVSRGVVDMAADSLWSEVLPGDFLMGVKSEGGPVPVSIPHALRVAITPVTLRQYRCFDPRHAPRSQASDNLPVTEVTWFQAVMFCRWLSHELGVTARLPTEAEWEYACRAGTTTAFWCGNQLDPRVAWFGRHPHESPRPVAEGRDANPWGLFDMHGNVLEWCHDWFGEYEESPNGGLVTDRGGPARGIRRVQRGGAFWSPAHLCRAGASHQEDPALGLPDVGFRVVLTPTS